MEKFDAPCNAMLSYSLPGHHLNRDTVGLSFTYEILCHTEELARDAALNIRNKATPDVKQAFDAPVEEVLANIDQHPSKQDLLRTIFAEMTEEMVVRATTKKGIRAGRLTGYMSITKREQRERESEGRNTKKARR